LFAAYERVLIDCPRTSASLRIAALLAASVAEHYERASIEREHP